MKAAEHMCTLPVSERTRSLCAALLLSAVAALSAGCSSELASVDDTYVPASVEENFPIKVVERPVKLSFDATPGGLRQSEVDDVIGFARQAGRSATTPVTVSYPAGNKLARQTAGQAATILVEQGVPRRAVQITSGSGRANVVTLVFAAKVAETKPCGNWSENMRGNQFNESGPNFGCTVQQNIAAMVSNPEDFQHPRATAPASSAAQAASLENYYGGKWTTATKDSFLSGSFGQ